MAQTVVKATKNREVGSSGARRMRREGQLPGVLYGLSGDPVSVAVNYIELRNALKGPQGMNTVFDLDVDGNPETVIVRDVQRDAVKRVVTHADFLRIDTTKPVRVNVPVHITGDARGVTEEGGLIEQKLFELSVESLPLTVPTEILADVTIMTLERSLSVADLNLPEGVVSLIAEDVSVVAPVIPRAIEETVATPELGEDGEPIVPAEGEEGAEGEGAEGAEGEAAKGEESSS